MVGNWDTANAWSKWTFQVANEMINHGVKTPLVFDTIMPMPANMKANGLLSALEVHYKTSRAIWFVPRLLVALIKCQGSMMYVTAFWSVVESAVRIASPVCLRYLLISLSSSSPSDCYMWAAILAGLNLIQTIVHHVLFYFTMKIGWEWKMASTAFIYSNLFKLKSSRMSGAAGGNSIGTGKLVNLISNDVSRFEEFAVWIQFIWVSLLEVIAILLILIYYLNVASGFAAVGMTAAIIPLQVVLARQFSQLRGKTAVQTDHRVRFISEVIDGISTVKSYGWEIPFFKFIGKFRSEEMKFVFSSQYLRAINLALYSCGSTIAAFAAFAVFWATGGVLTFPLVFSTLSLIQQLRVTIGRQWTRGVETGSEVKASCTRIDAFLASVEAEVDVASSSSASAAASATVPSQSGESWLTVPRSSFSYDEGEEASKTLSDIEFSVKSGELLMVVGSVGSGKSSLLNAILGEMHSSSEDTQYVLSGLRFAYCAQRPWIVASSVRTNIVLAGKVDGDKAQVDLSDTDEFKNPSQVNDALYRKALLLSRIIDDLKQWSHADETEIGERGISISGGQKARISLARAIYSDADVFLLDDVLSAVDAHVGRALFFDCIVDGLRNQGKAVVLATHQIQYLKYADKILVIGKDGHQKFYGSYAELQSCGEDFELEVEKNVQDDTGTASESESPPPAGKVKPDLKTAKSQKTIRHEEEEEEEEEVDVEPASHDTGSNKVELSADESSKAAEASPEQAQSTPKAQLQGIQVEEKAEGILSWKVVWTYIMSGGPIKLFFAVSLCMITQGLLMVTDYWLKWWAGEFLGSQGQAMYLWVYAILTFLSVLFSFVRAVAWFDFTFHASKQLQESALWALLHTPMAFFVANPSGRILNRFSRDQNQIDELLPYTLFDCLQTFLFSFAAIVIVCVSLPWLILTVPPLVYSFVLVRTKYMKNARELRRIEATLRSPIYADFSATLEGLVTLRAFDLQIAISKSFQIQLDRNSRAWFSFLMVSRWLGFRLDIESALILVAVCFLAAILRHSVDVGLIGFALTYIMQLSGLLQWAARQSGEAENMMTCVERISAYAELEPEPGYSSTLVSVRARASSVGHDSRHDGISGKPVGAYSKVIGDEPAGVEMSLIKKSGNLSIKDLTVTYRSDMDPVLKNLTFQIPNGTKVGICGRTGSGKSSTLLALLRLNVITSGDIVLNGESLLKMDLETSRGKLSTIPQDPHLFSGSIRFNLDPFSNYSDADIWIALEDACIKDHIAADSKGLDMEVSEGGKNFSAGQRQLLSLARAILRKCPIVLMDEVTASIDYATDRAIQHTIRHSPALREATIITVAHRLRTIADSDQIIVIQAGHLVEMGTPAELLGQESSIFRALAVESNEFEEIRRLANKMETPLAETSM